jgi:hypothetical protein
MQSVSVCEGLSKALQSFTFNGHVHSELLDFGFQLTLFGGKRFGLVEQPDPLKRAGLIGDQFGFHA